LKGGQKREISPRSYNLLKNSFYLLLQKLCRRAIGIHTELVDTLVGLNKEKTKTMKKIFILALGCLLFSGITKAQSSDGEMRGIVTDAKSKAQLSGVQISLYKEGSDAGSTYTNSAGGFSFKPLTPGEYLIIYALKGYETDSFTVKVGLGSIAYADNEMNVVGAKGNEITGITVVTNKVRTKTKLIDKDGINGSTFDAKTLSRTGGQRDLTTFAAKTTGFGGGVGNIGGARSNGNAVFIDGIRVGNSVPRGSIEQLQVLVGGVPAMYGDFTGGVTNITTKGPSRVTHGGIEVLSSKLTDNYNYNLVEGFLQGPLWIKNKNKKTEQVMLGYSLGGNYTYVKDPNPSAIGNWYIKDSVLKSIEQTPLLLSKTNTGYMNAADLVTKDDMVNVLAKRNTPTYNYNLNGALKFQPTKKVRIDLGGFYSYGDAINYNFSNTLFNNSQNNHSTGSTATGYVKFTHTLKSSEKKKGDEAESKSIVSNAYYQIRFDYTQSNNLTLDATHKDKVFDYGYIGSFTTKRAPYYELVGGGLNAPSHQFITQKNGVNDTAYYNTYFEQKVNYDTAVWFVPDAQNRNAIRANYTKNFYTYQENLGRSVFSLDQIRANLALLNGDNPTSVYSMWNNVGSPGSGYGKSQTEKYTLFAMSEITLQSKRDPNKKHDLQFGIIYEQRFSRGWSISTTPLWSLMRQLAKQAEPALDRAHPILSYDANGVFQDSVSYNNIVGSSREGVFTGNLRQHLMAIGAKDYNGNPVGPNSYLDVDMYGPEHYKLSYFSPDELLNNGTAYVNYFGYDYLGNKLKGNKPSFADFFNDSAKRTIGAFQPIYQSAFIQDKFAFKDLIFRIGLRIDRYDANQSVLKDPYSLYPTKTVKEVRAEKSKLSDQLNPAMADDASVYVNDIENPTNILGYRSTNQSNNQTKWYDDNGVQINDPTVLATDRRNSTGRIAPYLVDNNPNQKLTAASFQAYRPKLYFMPRVWFKFPINDESQFFVNYDVLTQRPPEGVIATVDDYYYLRQRSTEVINNPALKPIRKTDYELGFKQQISSNAALSLTASYSEMRDLVQLFKYNQAYPISYTTFGNLDFGTVKSFRVEYEIRDAGPSKNINLTANYMLQFADGTGSNAGSSQALLNAGQPNLRTLFPLDYDTRHNIKGIFDFHFNPNDGPNYRSKDSKGNTVKIYPLQNAGINLTFQAQSGTPYTSNSQPINEGQGGVVQRSQIRGTVNGSRNPWRYLMDLTIDKTILIKNKGEVKKAPKAVNVYLWVNNLFNKQNITRVYRYTGSASDDGYLTSDLGRQQVSRANSSQSFIDMYNVRVNSPGNYYTPRLFRIGIKYNF